jgi:hypothetical protein
LDKGPCQILYPGPMSRLAADLTIGVARWVPAGVVNETNAERKGRAGWT